MYYNNQNSALPENLGRSQRVWIIRTPTFIVHSAPNVFSYFLTLPKSTSFYNQISTQIDHFSFHPITSFILIFICLHSTTTFLLQKTTSNKGPRKVYPHTPHIMLPHSTTTKTYYCNTIPPLPVTTITITKTTKLLLHPTSFYHSTPYHSHTSSPHPNIHNSHYKPHVTISLTPHT